MCICNMYVFLNIAIAVSLFYVMCLNIIYRSVVYVCLNFSMPLLYG